MTGFVPYLGRVTGFSSSTGTNITYTVQLVSWGTVSIIERSGITPVRDVPANVEVRAAPVGSIVLAIADPDGLRCYVWGEQYILKECVQ
jgi:hypothetical protein